MPQHLRIEAENTPLARLTTYNKGGTLYDITFCVPELCTDILLYDIDTGVQRQPQDSATAKIDFLDDFKYARRCVAAAFASSDKLLQHLQENRPSEHAKAKSIMMWLMTNKFARGLIHAHPTENNSVRVTVHIGTRGNRVPDALPENEWQRTYEGISISGAASHTERALMVISSIGVSLLHQLEQHETV